MKRLKILFQFLLNLNERLWSKIIYKPLPEFNNEEKIITLKSKMTWDEIKGAFWIYIRNGWRIEAHSFLKYCK